MTLSFHYENYENKVNVVGRTFVGFVELLGGLVEPVRRTLFGGSLNPLWSGCLWLTFCGFDELRLTLGGVLTDRRTHTFSSIGLWLELWLKLTGWIRHFGFHLA